jgi:hypothetical protein
MHLFVFMVRYIMVLRRARSILRALEGVGPGQLGPKKSRFPGPTPYNALSNRFARLKTIKYKLHVKNRYIGNFMYKSLLAAVLCVVVCRYCYGVGRQTSSTPPTLL